MRASRNGPAWGARSRGRATSRSSNACPDRARPTSGASPTCRRRSSARCCPPADLERRLDLLRACWAYFDDVAARVSAELRPGLAGGGRSRDQVIRHVYGTEPEQFSRKVGVRTPLEVVLTPDGLATHRQAYLDAIRAYNAEGRPARTWPIQFLVRRTAHHVMDHAWELEDRDLGASLDFVPRHDPAITGLLAHRLTLPAGRAGPCRCAIA